MSVEQLRPFPSHFRLKDLAAISAPSFDFKVNSHQEEAARAANAWFDSHNVYHGLKQKKFLSHRYDAYAGMGFPNADLSHLENCIAFFFWTFSFDDLSDEGALQSKPDAVQVGVDILMEVLRNPDAPPPNFPYAAMLCDIWRRFRSTASPGACNRFFRATESWMKSQVEQAQDRATEDIISVEDFIIRRRRSIGARLVEAMVEYSLDLQIPEYVWDDPIVQEMSKAMIDIMAWPNDLCSFNKEQADGDYQNLVFSIMIERDCDLQTAIDILTDMQAKRVAEYMHFKSQLRSFSPEVDAELARYNTAMEQYTQGTIIWYYLSPRYFRGQEVIHKPEVVVPVYPPSAAEPEQAVQTPADVPTAKVASLSALLTACESAKSLMRWPPLSLRCHARLSVILLSVSAGLLFVSYRNFPALPQLGGHMAGLHRHI